MSARNCCACFFRIRWRRSPAPFRGVKTAKKSRMFCPRAKRQADSHFCAYDESRLAECAAVFLAMPHGESMPIAPQLADKGVAVIDLGADFRLHSADDWKKHYGKSHTAAAWLDRSAYGLTEANRAQIKKAKIIACPGCYATAILLGLIPLIQGGAIKNHGIIADAKSGVSGAGKKKRPRRFAVRRYVRQFQGVFHRRTSARSGNDSISRRILRSEFADDFHSASAADGARNLRDLVLSGGKKIPPTPANWRHRITRTSPLSKFFPMESRPNWRMRSAPTNAASEFFRAKIRSWF